MKRLDNIIQRLEETRSSFLYYKDYNSEVNEIIIGGLRSLLV